MQTDQTALGRRFPGLPQIACFDTAFHHDLPRVAQLLPIPRRFEAKEVGRYGIHVLSYAFLMDELKRVAGEQAARGKIVLAHLGNGASLARCRKPSAFRGLGILMHSCWSCGAPAAVDYMTKCISTRRGRRIPTKNSLASIIRRPRDSGATFVFVVETDQQVKLSFFGNLTSAMLKSRSGPAKLARSPRGGYRFARPA